MQRSYTDEQLGETIMNGEQMKCGGYGLLKSAVLAFAWWNKEKPRKVVTQSVTRARFKPDTS
jgi:hypothetical protein